jgi:hypothetical protein
MLTMTESLGDLLRKRGRASANEPEEFLVIRKFVQDKFSVTPKLAMSKNAITISVPNAAVAGNLRFELYDLSKQLDTKLRLIIRINR